jgi:hypothetical protein
MVRFRRRATFSFFTHFTMRVRFSHLLVLAHVAGQATGMTLRGVTTVNICQSTYTSSQLSSANIPASTVFTVLLNDKTQTSAVLAAAKADLGGWVPQMSYDYMGMFWGPMDAAKVVYFMGKDVKSVQADCQVSVAAPMAPMAPMGVGVAPMGVGVAPMGVGVAPMGVAAPSPTPSPTPNCASLSVEVCKETSGCVVTKPVNGCETEAESNR